MSEFKLDYIEILMEQGRYDMAEKHIRERLATSPEEPFLREMLCMVLLNTGRPKEALEIAKRLLEERADGAIYHYLCGLAFWHLNDSKNALAHVKTAISLNPYDADTFALASQIAFSERRFEEAQKYAERGLEADPEHIICLNMRTQSLVKLDKKAEAFSNLDSTLEKDPENSFTHSNMGWVHLEKGSYKKASEHFREALRIDPNNEWAQQGLLESLKSRYVIYNLFLKYVFWLSKMSHGQQIGFFIGLYALTRVSRYVSENYPALEVVTHVVIGLYLLFILSNWVMSHIFNFTLLFNREGKYLVKGNDRISAIITGVCLILAILSGISYFGTEAPIWVNAAIFFLLSALGIGSMMDVDSPGKRKIAIGLSVFLFILGATSLVLQATEEALPDKIIANSLGYLFLYLSIGYTWLRGLLLN